MKDHDHKPNLVRCPRCMDYLGQLVFKALERPEPRAVLYQPPLRWHVVGYCHRHGIQTTKA